MGDAVDTFEPGPTEAEVSWHAEGIRKNVNPTIPMQKTLLLLQPAPTVAPQSYSDAEPTDEVLMARIQQHDEDALTMLYYRYSKLLQSVISRCVYDAHHAEDLLQ